MNRHISLRYEEGRLYLPVIVRSAGHRIPYTLIEFAVDTGSPFTFFSEEEVDRIKVSLKGCKVVQPIAYGGARYRLAMLKKVDLIVLDDHKEKIVFQRDILAIKSTKSVEGKQVYVSRLPSVLGLDFLEDHNLSLHVIPAEKMAYLESES